MKKTITVGGTLEQDAQAILDAVALVEKGEKLEPQDHVNFATWSALSAVMSDKRFELLQHLRRHPAENIRLGL